MLANRPRTPSRRRLQLRLMRLFERHVGRLEKEQGIVRRTLPDGRPFPRKDSDDDRG